MSDEILDIEEEKLFAEALELKRHKEQMSALKGIAASLNKPEKDDKAIMNSPLRMISLFFMIICSLNIDCNFLKRFNGCKDKNSICIIVK